MQSYDIIRIKKYKKKENSYGGQMKLDLDGAQPLRRKSRDNKVKEVFHSATGKSDNETKLGTKLGTVWGGGEGQHVRVFALQQQQQPTLSVGVFSGLPAGSFRTCSMDLLFLVSLNGLPRLNR